jgi:hypothetical protein
LPETHSALGDLISRADSRLSGKSADSAVVLRMTSAAGKTHSLLALYHAFSNDTSRPINGSEEGIPRTEIVPGRNLRSAVLSGSSVFHSMQRRKSDGTVIHTLWGELAWELGGRDAYEMVRDSDERGVSPGGSLVFLLQRYSPCMILIDDWAQYALQLCRDHGSATDSFDLQLDFATALSHAVRRTANSLLVATFPNASDESAGTNHQPQIEQLCKTLDPPATSVVTPLDERELLDDLFRATISYRSSQVYRDLLEYVSRFRRYSAYNCFLIRMQRPTVGYVATPSDWMKEFERWLKPDARPLVMLRPFGPVMFVYDIAETEGNKPPPQDLMKPFDARGALDLSIWSNTEKNCLRDGIRIVPRDMQLNSAGWARCTLAPGPKQTPEFEVIYNKNQTEAESYCTIAHELAHIYLGHLCGHPRRKWPDRGNETKDVKEFEAESVAYVVCARQGIMTTAPQYLADYLSHHDEIPPIYIDRVLVVASKIEEMGRTLKSAKNQSVEDL